MDKYVNTSDFDMNSFDAERVTARESQEKATKFFQNPNVIPAQEAKRKQEIEHAESLRRMQAADDLGFANRRDQERFRKQEELKEEKMKEEKLERERLEYIEKRVAVRSAYERYKNQSIFYRVFHKSVYKMDPYNKMNIEEINQLYGGKTK